MQSSDAPQTPDDAGSSDLGSQVDAGNPDMPRDTSGTDSGNANLRDEELLAVLRTQSAAAMRALGYNAARDAMYATGGIDDESGRIEGIYTGRTVETDDSRTPNADCRLVDGTPRSCAFNTEHVFARVNLRAGLGDGTPDYNAAEGDIHHLFPSEERANQERGNFDFGNTECESAGNCRFDEESQVGIPTGGSGPTNCPIGVDPGEDLCVMMVREVRRGDIARAVFYMAMRWNLDVPEPMETDLREWHAADPPDDRETRRNDLIEITQGNRNPFVDEPLLVDRIADF